MFCGFRVPLWHRMTVFLCSLYPRYPVEVLFPFFFCALRYQQAPTPKTAECVPPSVPFRFLGLIRLVSFSHPWPRCGRSPNPPPSPDEGLSTSAVLFGPLGFGVRLSFSLVPSQPESQPPMVFSLSCPSVQVTNDLLFFLGFTPSRLWVLFFPFRDRTGVPRKTSLPLCNLPQRVTSNLTLFSIVTPACVYLLVKNKQHSFFQCEWSLL